MSDKEREAEKLFKMMESYSTRSYLHSEENDAPPNKFYYWNKLVEALERAEKRSYEKGFEDGQKSSR